MKSGGGSNLGKYFCPFCPCLNYHRGEISTFNSCKNKCSEKGRDCYCYSIVDSQTIEAYSSDRIVSRHLACNVTFPKSTSKKQVFHDFAMVSIYLFHNIQFNYDHLGYVQGRIPRL